MPIHVRLTGMRVPGLLLLVLLLPASAAAQQAPSALQRGQAAYTDGDWDRAEARGREAGGVEGYTLAAEAVLAGLMSWEEDLDRPQAARDAQAYGERAVALDASHADARLRLAAALGYRGRYMSSWRAFFTGIPQDGRDHIVTAMELAPDDPWAHALFGAWHMEVVRQGGEGTLGASLETGLDHYRSAARNAPDEPGIAYHLAIAQLAQDPGRFGEEAAQWLAQAAGAEVDEAYDRAMKTQARALAGLLARDREAAHEDAVYRLEN